MHVRALLLASLALTACASTERAPLPPLDAPADVAVDYDARVAPGIWEPADEGFDAGPEVDLESVETFVDLGATFIVLDADQVEDLFGARRYGPWAVTTSRHSGARVLDALAADITHSQNLAVAEGQRGSILIARQTAFIEGFEIEHEGTSMIADPVVNVATDGMKLDFLAQVDGDSIELEIEFVQSELQRPIGDVDVMLPSLHVPTTIQQPITSQQTLRVVPTLEPRQALLLCMPVPGESGRFLIGHVTAEVVLTDDVAPGGEEDPADGSSGEPEPAEETAEVGDA
jgi:hypothetical protein